MILTIGDSVAWGQGLPEEYKFDRQLATAKRTGLLRLAHSGAILGAPTDDSTERAAGEVPIPYPSLWQQTRSFSQWKDVDLVLLSGGIVDVSLGRILSPWVTHVSITKSVTKVCHQAMQQLLLHIASALRPTARIALVGYYPIVSPQSGYPSTGHSQTLLKMRGVTSIALIPDLLIPSGTLMSRTENNCLHFWRQSNLAYQRAVDEANATLPHRPCLFIPTPFAEHNAMWTPGSLLFEFASELGPEDPIAPQRARSCAATFNELTHPIHRYRCDRASAGHPSIHGARKIAESLIAAL